jgi:hypothetical protein
MGIIASSAPAIDDASGGLRLPNWCHRGLPRRYHHKGWALMDILLYSTTAWACPAVHTKMNLSF